MMALLVMTDGRRDCIERAIPSALERLHGRFTEFVIHDDSGDDAYHEWLTATFPQFQIVMTPGRSGFGGAIRSAWSHLAAHTEAHFIFHLEDDFIFNEDIDVVAMARLLTFERTLMQVALKRQPWNDIEIAAGGIVECAPEDYMQVTNGDIWWTAHRRFFTTNPNLYRASLVHEHWPEGENSEGHFTHQLLARRRGHPFAFWGRKFDPPKVTHIGNQRAGTGY